MAEGMIPNLRSSSKNNSTSINNSVVRYCTDVSKKRST